MNKFLFSLLVVGIVLTGISCQKGPGIGGQASVRGKVSGILYNKYFTSKLDSGNVVNWTVNILYGGDIGVDATQKTGYDGSYEFAYLRPGHYTIFVYSRSHKTNLADSSIVVGLDITSKKQVLNLSEIKILR
jgi:hypothetical protein